MAVRPSAFVCGAFHTRAMLFFTLVVVVSVISKLFIFGPLYRAKTKREKPSRTQRTLVTRRGRMDS
jgi:hypothetical protein